MRRMLCLIMTCLLLAAVLSGCWHEHTWANATCTAPMTCLECGQISGEALGHIWSDATCEAPQTCTRCDATMGTALGHTWLPATCTAAQTCSVCFATQGTPLGHSYSPWTEPRIDRLGQWSRTQTCTVCANQTTEQVPAPHRTDLGTAGELGATTIIVTILAEDATTSWDLNSATDQETLELMLLHLGSGVDWLTRQVSGYGVNTRFIYDWNENPDLCYTYDFGGETLVRTDGGGYDTQVSYIRDNIPTGDLQEKYQAQNVIYMFFFNTSEENEVNSWCMSDNCGVETEIINVFVRDTYSAGVYYMPASSFAHEIMHCFGAYDLYYASDKIPQSYVDHCAATGSNDIMYTVSVGVSIPQDFTPLDAYYLGLIDSCDEIYTWGLIQSTHAKE